MLPLIVGIESTRLSPTERELFSRYQPAGYILFSRNIEYRDECIELCESLHELHRGEHAPIIAIDQEGGRVVRTTALGLELPSAQLLAQQADSALITEAAHLTAHTLRALGINTNFAPVLDIASSQSKALPSRCWGEQCHEVISHAGVWNRELQRQGIMSCGKHFPGMGEANLDPHHALPVLHGTRDDFLASASIPFLTLMPELPSLMLAHLSLPELDPDYPASLSSTLITDFLRGQLGYQGLIFSDDLCMGAITEHYGLAEAALLSLQAGCDLPLLCHDAATHLEAVAERITALSDGQLTDIKRRVARFCVHMPSPPPYHDYLEWRELLRRAESLGQRCSRRTLEAESQNSPVFHY